MRDTRLGVMLNPSIPGRQGFLLNKKRLNTNEFDATFMLSFDDSNRMGNSAETTPSKGQRVSIHFTPGDLSLVVAKITRTKNPDWTEALRQVRFDTVAKQGLSVDIFPVDEKTGTRVPYVRISVGNRQETKRLFLKESETSLIQLSFLRLRLRVRSDTVVLLFQEVADWRPIVELKSVKIPKSGFLGITCETGSGNTKAVPYRSWLTSFHVKSYDLNASPDEVVVNLIANEGLTISELLDNNSYLTRVSQTRILNKLSKVLQEYMKSTVPLYSSFKSQIAQLQRNMTEMDGFLVSLTKESKYTFSSIKSRNVVSLGSQVKSIHDALSQIEKDREELVRSAREVEALSDHSSHNMDRHLSYYERQLNSRGTELNEILEQQNKTTLILFLIVFSTAVVMGIIFFYKLRSYAEKAHFF